MDCTAFGEARQGARGSGAAGAAATDAFRLWYAQCVPRRVRIWTWDRGNQPVDMDGSVEFLRPILETVLQGGLWLELRRFPPDTLERLLPCIDVPPNIRRLVEIWVEEKRSAPAA